MKRWWNDNTAVFGLVLILVFLVFLVFRTAIQRDEEHRLRLEAIGKIEQSLQTCQPAVVLRKSERNPGTNAVDAVPMIKYRDAQNGHACVFLADGRYGDLWWSIIVENKGEKAHLEWNFNERGRYKW